MSAIATGVFKNVTFKRQTALGTIAPGGAATGQYLRRTKSTVDLAKATYKSAEILLSQQRRDFRHGVKSIAGTISGEVSVGGYQPFCESICRAVVAAADTTGAQTNITAAVTVAPAGTFTRAAGSFITDGFNIGDIINWSGWATTGVPNNANNFIITALTALVMTCYPVGGAAAVAAKASGDSVTCVLVGKKTALPPSGQLRHYYTIEHWFGDITQSEVFQDCVISKMSVKLPPTGMATVDWDVMGLNMITNTAQYFSSPTAAPTGGIEASVNGILLLNGLVVGLITSLNFDVNGNYSAPGGVVGTNLDPDIFPGSVDVTGTMTVLFQDNVIRDYFVNETEVSLMVALTANNTVNAPFTSFVFPRIKAGGAAKDDQEKGLTLTMPFTALENTGIAAANLSTLAIQDSAFT